MHLVTSFSFYSVQSAIQGGLFGALCFLCCALINQERQISTGGYTCRLQIYMEGQLVLNCTRLKHFCLGTLALL